LFDLASQFRGLSDLVSQIRVLSDLASQIRVLPHVAGRFAFVGSGLLESFAASGQSDSGVVGSGQFDSHSF
jgi:hypothetical protein